MVTLWKVWKQKKGGKGGGKTDENKGPNVLPPVPRPPPITPHDQTMFYVVDKGESSSVATVSYTHLTLPTILLV